MTKDESRAVARAWAAMRSNERGALLAAYSNSDCEVWLDPNVIHPGDLYDFRGTVRGSASLYRLTAKGRRLAAYGQEQRR